MKPYGLMSDSQGLTKNFSLSQINPIPRIDTDFLMAHDNIDLLSTSWSS